MCSSVLLNREQWTALSYWPSRIPFNGSDTLFRLCRNLVTWDSQLKVIKFAHLSVKEYLDSVFDSLDANTMAAGCCLSILDRVLPGSRKMASDYAIKYWPHHMNHAYSRERHLSKDLLDKLNNFLGPPNIASKACLNWLLKAIQKSVIMLGAGWNMINVSPLFIASYFNFGEELHHQWKYDNIKLSIGDRFPALLDVACGRGNAAVVGFLLRNHTMTGIKWGNGPLREAIVNGYGDIAVQLASSGVHHPSTDYQTMLEMAVLKGDPTVVEAFMQSGTSFQITEDVLIAARSRYNSDMIDFLLHKGFDSKITEAILVAASGKSLKGLEKLLNHSSALSMAAILNAASDDDFITLLDRCDETQITEAVLIAAIRHNPCRIVEYMLARCPSIPIPEAVLIAIANCRYRGRGMMTERERNEMWMKLLSLDMGNEIRGRIMVALTGPSGTNTKEVELLLTRYPYHIVTENMLIALARYGYPQSMKQLLDKNLNIAVRNYVWLSW